MFISDADLTTVLDDTQMAQVIDLSTSKRNRAEHFALEESRSFLNFHYDVELIFGFEVFDYSATDEYKEGQIIVSDEAVGYTCILDAPAGTALTNDTYFEEGDARNPLIVMITVDLLAYHLFSGVSTNMIPQHIIDRYEQSIKKLTAIRKQTMNPLLPVKVIDEDAEENPNNQTHTISIFSHPKRNNFYD